MTNVKAILATVAFVGAIGSAFATKPMANRNLYTNSDGSCSLIFCRTNNIENLGACQNTHTKYTNATCTNVYNGAAFIVQTP